MTIKLLDFSNELGPLESPRRHKPPAQEWLRDGLVYLTLPGVVVAVIAAFLVAEVFTAFRANRIGKALARLVSWPDRSLMRFVTWQGQPRKRRGG